MSSQELTGTIPPPQSLILGICDLIYRDPGSGKRFVLGCFNTIFAPAFPHVHSVLGIYIDLVNGRGDMPLRLQIVDVDDVRPPVWLLEPTANFPDPNTTIELDLMLGGLAFPEPGDYRVQVYSGEHLIVERRLLLNLQGAQ